MRRCHSGPMQDYRREHNREMWDRPLLRPVTIEDAAMALQRDYPGKDLLTRAPDWAWAEWVQEQGVGE